MEWSIRTPRGTSRNIFLLFFGFWRVGCAYQMSQAILELERCHASSIKAYADRLWSGAGWTAGAEGTPKDARLFTLCREAGGATGEHTHTVGRVIKKHCNFYFQTAQHSHKSLRLPNCCGNFFFFWYFAAVTDEVSFN